MLKYNENKLSFNEKHSDRNAQRLEREGDDASNPLSLYRQSTSVFPRRMNGCQLLSRHSVLISLGYHSVRLNRNPRRESKVFERGAEGVGSVEKRGGGASRDAQIDRVVTDNSSRLTVRRTLI